MGRRAHHDYFQEENHLSQTCSPAVEVCKTSQYCLHSDFNKLWREHGESSSRELQLSVDTLSLFSPWVWAVMTIGALCCLEQRMLRTNSIMTCGLSYSSSNSLKPGGNPPSFQPLPTLALWHHRSSPPDITSIHHISHFGPETSGNGMLLTQQMYLITSIKFVLLALNLT